MDERKDKIQDEILEDFFRNIYPKNTNLKDILVKVTLLNSFYSTNIYDLFSLAEHIKELKIDKSLNDSDKKLVEEITKITIGGKKKTFYSFATKYCSHHNPNEFPIYDSYVDEVLWYFIKEEKEKNKGKEGFWNYKRCDLKNYETFKDILRSFKEYYKIDEYSFKQIDQYLWLLGKEYFK